jgi:ribonuclease VapC
MVIDTSALLAILLDEPDGDALLQQIVDDPVRLMSAGTLLEAGIVADNIPNRCKGPALDALLSTLGVRIESVTEEQVRLAREVCRRFGKGNHRAALNFGDCFAYALSKSSGEPLLFKGADFPATDVEACRSPWPVLDCLPAQQLGQPSRRRGP